MENNQRPTIAIMLGDTQSSYSEDLLRGFYTCAREEDINIIFLMGPQMPQYCKDILSCSFDGDYNYQFDTIYDYVHFTKPDALIITYGSLSIFKSNQVKADFLSHYKDIPFLMLEDTPDDPDIPYLIADNYNGMRQCIEHLVNVHGYRKIAFVAGPANNKDSNERLKAYRDVMAEHQLPVTNDMVVYGNYSELVTEQVEYILDHNPELEAIAFANDNMAKAGYRVCAASFPQQLPVQLPGITECAYALSGKEATILPDVSHFSPEKLLRLPAAHRLYHTASYQHGAAARFYTPAGRCYG